MGTDLAMTQYGGYKTSKPSGGLLNNMFMYTVNMAAKTLVSVAQTSKAGEMEKWSTIDHLRFMLMLMSWLTVWALRVLMDHLPFRLSFPYFYIPLGSFSLPLRLVKYLLPSPSSSSSSSSALALPSSAYSSLDMVLYEEAEAPSVRALGRSLAHTLALLNEIPATSSKYQFAMSMAERIMDGNACHESAELLDVNRAALSSAFAHTSTLLYRSMKSAQSQREFIGWPVRTVQALPFGDYVVPYVKGLTFCFNTAMSWINAVGTYWFLRNTDYVGPLRHVGAEEYKEAMAAEKLAQELLWITDKLRAYSAVEEALVQWSSSPGLASLALTASPRVQGLIVRLSAILFGDMNQKYVEVTREVKFKMLVLWLPLFSYAGNGFAYPVLSSYEKFEIERTVNELISSLPAMDQEVILTNWVHDFAVTASDWPNLQPSYDRWCHSARRLVT